MAELDDKLIQNLNQRLQTMETLLSNLTKTLGGVKEGMVSAFNPAIVKSWSDSIKGLKTIRLIDAEKAKTDIKEINDTVRVLTQEYKHGRVFTPFSEEEKNATIARLASIRVEIENLNRKAKSKAGLTEDEALTREALRQQRDILYMETRRGGKLGAFLSPQELSEVNEQLAKYKALQTDIAKGSERRAAELANLKRNEELNALKQEAQLNKEIAEDEKKRTAEARQRYAEAQAANKALNKEQDALEKRQRSTRVAESKSAWKADVAKQVQNEQKMNQAIQQQIQYYRQLHTLYKGYKDLQAKPNKTKEDIAILEQTKQKILEILRLSKQLELENKGSRQAGINATGFQRLADNLRNASKETKTLKANLNNLLPTIQRLASAFGVAFSVRGLAQFGKKLIETRGEFEMQFVAMKQIIGDVDAATKIWNQTMQQALQSPFKAMQLVTYTKQLAAYRIETDKLFETTKRLADVSAGLGVDMQRLILAYGQVKSANFLRASEVRQFTEAGVNIVGSLSQYFSELENRAVSTADVMERITKRMVLFSDVEEIFKRMTDEGGTFYNMQEVQADTVKGQIAKLHDAYDQMLNTIGQANQGTLRDLIGTLNDMVKNWRNVALFLKENGIALLAIVPLVKAYRKGVELAATETAYFTTTTTGASLGLQRLSFSERLATMATHTFRGAIFLAKTALKTFVPLMVIEGIVLLINKMTEAGRTAKQLTRTLDEVGSKNSQSLQDNIDGFDKLVKKLEEANEGSQEYLDIRNKIQSQYGEYLDNLSLEQITVENLALAYDKVVERMREKSRQHIFEEGLQEITNVYGDALTKFQKNLADFAFTTGLDVTKDEAVTIAKRMYEMYEKNEKYRGMKNPVSLLNDALKEYYGEEAVGRLNFAQLSIGNDFYKAIELRYEKEIDLATKANALTKANSDTHAEYLEQLRIEAEHEQRIHDIRNDSSVLSKERMNVLLQAEEVRYAEEKLELQAKYQKKGDEWLKNEKDKLKENYGAFLNAYNEQVKAYIGGRFGEGWMKGDNSDAWKAYNFMIANQDRLSQGQTKWEEKILNDKKLTEENIQRIKEQQATQTAADSEAAKALNESLKQEEDRLELIKKQMELLGLHEKQKGGSGSANNSIYGERIRLLQDMLQKYKQLAKEAYGYAKAEGKVSESFEDAWNSIMPAGYGDLEVPTSYKALAEMLQRLEAFTPAFDKNGQLSKMLADLKKAVSDALSQVDIELSVRIREDFGKQMEKAFGDYELTIELKKLDITGDAAKDWLGVDYTSLGEMLEKMNEFADKQIKKGTFDEEDAKIYQQWAKKIEDQIYKNRKEKAKDYSKYLEQEFSERAKLEMEYAKKVADVKASPVFQGEQEEAILNNMNREFNEKLQELTWKSFKESDFYIEMMEDLTSIPAEYSALMLTKLNEILMHPEKLLPRALKEAINARQKIMEARRQMNPALAMTENAANFRAFFRSEDNRKEFGLEAKTWRQAEKEIDKLIIKKTEELAQLDEELQIYDDLIGEIENYNRKKEEYEQKSIGLEGDPQEEIEQRQEILQPLLDEQTRYEELRDAKQSGESVNEAELVRMTKELPVRQTKIEQLKAEIEAYRQLEEARKALAQSYAGLSEDAQTLVGGGEIAIGSTTGITSGNLSSNREGTVQKKDSTKNSLQRLKEAKKMSKEFAAAWHEFNAQLNDTINKVKNMGNAFYDTYEALGGETDALTEGWKEFGNTMVDVITQALSMIPTLVTGFTAAGVAINSAMGIIGLIAEAIQLVIVLVGAFAKLHDAGYEKEIENQQKIIDNLQRAYDRLEKQIEKTWDTASYIRTYNEETQNLYAQIEALNKQIAAEEAKKNTDKDKLQDYKDKIQDAEDELEELKQKQIEVFGGIGKEGYRDAAQGFVDAWKSAFLETGDGLQGLQDHFDEFLNDWFVKQATMRIAANNLEPLFRKIDQAVDKNGLGGANVTWQELEEINDLKDLLLTLTNEQLKELAGVFGIGGEGSLSGLAAGIQGMTEEQANILEAYWNDVRMDTNSINENVATIVSLLSNGTSGGVGGGRGNIFGDPNVETNPMLKQLDLIAVNTAATHSILESVTKSGHSQGGYGIKVFAD